MEHNNEHTEIFTPSGCLTTGAVRSYVSGTLSDIQKEQIVEHLEQCELCALAVEGMTLYILEKGGESYDSLLSELKTALEEKVPDHTPEKASRKVRTLWSLAAVAATVIMLLGLYQVIKMFVPEHQQLAQVTTDSAVSQKFSEMNIPPPEISDESENPVKNLDKETKMVRGIPDQDISRTSDIQQSDNLNEIVTEDLKKTVLPQTVTQSKPTGKTLNDTFKLAGVSKQQADQVQAVPAMNQSAGSLSKGINNVPVTAIHEKDISISAKGESYAVNEEESSPIFTLVEEMPEFPGGEKARNTFLKENIHYPKTAKDSGISGTVFVSFVVDEKGKIKEARVIKGIGSGCDEEALRVIKIMPRWLPGKQAGKPVRVQFTMPVKFAINE